jgi:RNA polymerase sigma-70 factor (ECF subfamily)
VIDAYRRRDVRSRRAAPVDENALMLAEPSDDDDPALCECFRELLPALKPEYADILAALDLGDEDTAAYARRAGLTPSNLKVRRHRARKALRQSLMDTCRLCADHGCLDCTCEV